MIITEINVTYKSVSDCLRLSPHRRRRGREKKDKDTGYLKGSLYSQFQQEIRQYLVITLSGTLKTTRMNGAVTISSTAFLRISGEPR
jgi:hypothetical protein